MTVQDPLSFDIFRHPEMIQLERELSQAKQQFDTRKQELKALCQQEETTKYRDKVTDLLQYNSNFFNSFIATHGQARLKWEQDRWQKSQQEIYRNWEDGRPIVWEQQAKKMERDYWWYSYPKRVPRQIRRSNQACIAAYFAKFRAEQALKANHDYYVAFDSLTEHSQQKGVPPAIQQTLQNLMASIAQEKAKQGADIYALTQALVNADELFKDKDKMATSLNMSKIDKLPGSKNEVLAGGADFSR